MVSDLLADVPQPPPRVSVEALVVPHAGYRYSGPVAASAYGVLRGMDNGQIQRVVLLGPSHFVPLQGMAVPATQAFATPLGLVAVDEQLRTAAVRRSDVLVDDEPHQGEHSLEVQLPFLQHVLPDRPLLPVLVGKTEPREVADLLDVLMAAPGSVAVVSTDLSHYLDDATAKEHDIRTAQAVLARDAKAIRSQDACGAAAVRGLLEWGRRRALSVEQLDLRTSGDTAGDRSRVVGYGAFAMRS
jgi:AmmeMemoRadiSam system protein B